MGLLLPIALALLALAIPIIIFYMLKLRRRERSVSSSLLWRRALMDRTANAPWQRLRRNFLLLLQLLLLLLLVLVLARPFIFSNSPIEGNAVIVLDASASMGTVDAEGGKSRWSRAAEEVEWLINGLGSGSRMSLIWAGPNPTLVASGPDKASLLSALHRLQPSNGRGDIESALVLAAGASQQLGGATVALISDGAFETSAELPVMDGPVLYLPVGESGRNLGITALSVRDTPSGPEAFASVYNSGEVTATALLSVLVDGDLRDSRRVEVGPGGDAGVTFGGLPLDTRRVKATLATDVSEGDTLSTDNRAWAVRSRASDGGVLLVTAGNGFLEKALTLLPGLRVFKIVPSAFVPSDDYALTVFDGSMPPQLPPGNLLLFAPTDSPLIPVSGTLELPQVGQVEVNDPLLRFVDLSDLHVGSAVRMAVPDWARVLVRTTDGAPLLVAGETEGQRVVAFAFDLHRSDLPLRVAFPILLANIVEWLRPTSQVSAPTVLRAGEPITVRLLPEADKVVVTLPGEGGEEVALQEVTGGEAQFAGTDRLGVYMVRQFVGDRPLGEPESFAVNLFSREESSIAPRSDVGLRGSAPAPTGSAGRPVEIWPWILFGAIVLLGLEWWVYNRAGRSLFPARRERPAAGR
jgi:hypothetical protein